MLNNIKYVLLLCSLLVLGLTQTQAQYRDPATAKDVVGVVLSADDLQPLENAQVGSSDIVRSRVSGAKGMFRIKSFNNQALLNITKDGYFPRIVELLGRDSIVVYMQPIATTMATDRYTTPDGERPMTSKISSAEAVNTKDINRGYFSTSDALTGRLTGLRVANKSGMVGEGSFINLRGTRSLLGQNTPLIVVDGIPYMPNQEISSIINGFSSDILEPTNLRGIEQVTLLKGADAMSYGSLGSNGVLLIETEKGKVSRTLVEFQTVEGIGFVNKTMPLLGGLDFNRYIADVAGTRYSGSTEIGQDFPFLSGNMTADQKVKYGFDTDWQKEIYSPAFVSDNMIKVRGGDAVVQYLVTAGFQGGSGVIEETSRNKFYTTGNTNINFSEKLKAFASVSFDFVELNLQEQGLSPETNPLLAAYSHSPLTGIREVDENGIILAEYARIDPVMNVSNPVAMLSEIKANSKIYNILVNAGMNYKITKRLQADVKFGIYYNYNKDDIFVGGLTSGSIAPLMGGLASNSVRSGASEAKNYYGKATLNYNLPLGDHNLDLRGGWQIMSSILSASSGSGINSSSDRYRTLTNASLIGRSSGGYAETHNWMDIYLNADYSFKHQLYLSATGVVDASSTYGNYSKRWYVLPGAKAGWKISNAPFLRDNKFVSNLMLRGEYSVNPNSRYSSSYGSYYYMLKLLRDVSGLVRAGVPNQKISPERVTNMDIGVDFSMLGDRFSMSADVFQEYTRDMIVDNVASPVYGSGHIYRNSGAMRTRGVELSASALVLNRVGFRWRVGANIAHYKSRIMSLGSDREQTIELSDDVTIINRVGHAPFSYYGHSAQGIYSTNAQASEQGLKTLSGYKFTGGDVCFNDSNADDVISDGDKQILGSPAPDFFGGFYSKMTWKGFSLFANFSYSYGSELYNGTRRYNESGDRFSNQSASMGRRWVRDGQVTDIPRVTYGDQAGNNRFSSRWIEDGSYLKLKELTVSWETHKKFLFMTGFKVFVTAENLFCVTNYTGSDPEFAYSYDMELLGMDVGKIPVPKFIKVGLVMNF